MKTQGFLSRNFLVQSLGLLFSIVVVTAVYQIYIWPVADDVEITNRLQATQNPDDPFIPEKSVAVLLKNEEQFACLLLMLWATIIIGYKFFLLRGEQSMTGHRFVNISRGERILPEDALSHYKEVESEVHSSPRFEGKILPEVIMAALHRFDATRSIQDAAHAVKERAEMAYDQLESDLSLIRYIAWAIPSVGFIGTVRGISQALGQADLAIQGDISGVTSSLGLAFNSTFIALLLSIALMLLVHLLQSKQENLLIQLEEIVTKRIIGMMKTPSSEETVVTYS